jgi:hypothetical protein
MTNGGSEYNHPVIPDPFLQLFVALGLGLLVGLQRERVDPILRDSKSCSIVPM